MQLTSEEHLDDGVIERDFVLDGIPGIIWTPASRAAPLILVGHPGGLGQIRPRLAARARHSARHGFASVSIELPGSGDRPRSAVTDGARTQLRLALAAGEPVGDDVVDALILPLVESAVPEWRATLEAVSSLPEISSGPVGFSGGVIAIGIRMALVEPRVAAAVLFAGSYVPRATLEEARQVTIPLQVLLQWDDVGNDRQMALDLFDALGSREKTLHANLGGHTGVPAFEAEAADRFLARHVGRAADDPASGERADSANL